jgi:predicted CXXCH cytochrome family protein
MNKRNAILIFGILAIVAAIAIVVAADEPEDHGTRAGETYVGSESCKTCHNNTAWDFVYDTWEHTPHGIDFSVWDYHGTPTNKYTYAGGNDTTGMTGGCASCHVVGYDQTAIGGFDPALPWNDTYNLPLLRIGCENCHGPGSAHVSSMSADDIDLGIDKYSESCAGTDDAGCHSGTRQYGTQEIHGWGESAHAPFDNQAEEEPGGLNTYCAECKSPSQWDPEATYGSNEPVAKEDWRGVTCADCHDVHNTTEFDYQLKWDPETICEECHTGGHHETMRNEEFEGEPSVNVTLYSYMDEVACVECHMWSTPHGTPEEYAVIGHSFEPKVEACVECHTDVYDNMPDDDYPHANWTAWNVTLQEAIEEWDGVIKDTQARYMTLFEHVEHLLDDVEDIMDIAEGNGTWTEELEELYEQAEYDFELAEHNSLGAHNPAYATDLLYAAEDGLNEILEELEMGTIKGWVTDEDAAFLADAYITVNGHGTKTDSNGMYVIMIEPGTYDMSAYILGTTEKTVADVSISAAEVVTQNFTLAPDFDNDGIPDATDPDKDNDHLPDDWEVANGLDPYDHTDCEADNDNDGKTNQQEYADQTDPQVADKEAVVEETDTTMYLLLIIVLIVIVVALLIMNVMKKGGATKPQPEPEPEPPAEEAEEEE